VVVSQNETTFKQLILITVTRAHQILKTQRVELLGTQVRTLSRPLPDPLFFCHFILYCAFIFQILLESQNSIFLVHLLQEEEMGC
jgi:hypothetical protein